MSLSCNQITTWLTYCQHTKCDCCEIFLPASKRYHGIGTIPFDIYIKILLTCAVCLCDKYRHDNENIHPRQIHRQRHAPLHFPQPQGCIQQLLEDGLHQKQLGRIGPYIQGRRTRLHIQTTLTLAPRGSCGSLARGGYRKNQMKTKPKPDRAIYISGATHADLKRHCQRVGMKIGAAADHAVRKFLIRENEGLR